MKPSRRDVHKRTAGPDLLEQVLARENMARAWKRVKANKGSAGVDGRTVQDTGDALKSAWPDIRKARLDGSYRPFSRAPCRHPRSRVAGCANWG